MFIPLQYLCRLYFDAIGIFLPPSYLSHLSIFWHLNIYATFISMPLEYLYHLNIHAIWIFMSLEYFFHLNIYASWIFMPLRYVCWSGFKDEKHILSSCQRLIYAINCTCLPGWSWWWSRWSWWWPWWRRWQRPWWWSSSLSSSYSSSSSVRR